MEALLAAASCGLMMVVAVAALAWFALTGRKGPTTPANASGGSDEVAALRDEIAELRRDRADDEAVRRL